MAIFHGRLMQNKHVSVLEHAGLALKAHSLSDSRTQLRNAHALAVTWNPPASQGLCTTRWGRPRQPAARDVPRRPSAQGTLAGGKLLSCDLQTCQVSVSLCPTPAPYRGLPRPASGHTRKGRSQEQAGCLCSNQ